MGPVFLGFPHPCQSVRFDVTCPRFPPLPLRSSQAAARHQCLYLVQQHSAGFLEAGGEESWLSGLEHAPGKLRSLQTLNKLLAHRPWLITQQHIQVRRHTLLAFQRRCCWKK